MTSPHKASRRQEERIAKATGGRRTPGSGNGFRKNDVRTSEMSFEMKYTGKKQYTLKASELEQGEKHAIMDGREFAFGIELNGRNWIVVDEGLFLYLLNREASHGP